MRHRHQTLALMAEQLVQRNSDITSDNCFQMCKYEVNCSLFCKTYRAAPIGPRLSA